jgi:hypothetical protein
MRFPSKTLAALLVAGSLPLMPGPVAAAPLSQSMGLKNADVSAIDQVQWRRGWRGGHRRGGGRWVGPAIGGFVAGAIVGGALSGPRDYDDGYYAYGAAPEPYGYGSGYAYGPGWSPRTSDDPGPGSSPQCTRSSDANSAYPSWMCR